MNQNNIEKRRDSLTPQHDYERQPSEILNELLQKQPYSDLWGQFVQRRRSPGVSLRAVATFMAYELSDVAGHEMSPEQLKDSVRRALNGELITDRTVNRFIAAFGFNDEESNELWRSVVRSRQLELAVKTDPFDDNFVFDPNREKTHLSETIKVHCDRYGLTKSLDITQILKVDRDGLQYLKPVVEGFDLDMELLEGGEIVNINESADRIFETEFNTVYGIYIKTPYPLYKGEIYRIRMKVYLKETHAENGVYNYFRAGAAEGPKFDVTTIINFDEPLEDVKHCVWDDKSFENPMLEEAVPEGLTHYSIHYPIIHKAYCGFQWNIVPLEES